MIWTVLRKEKLWRESESLQRALQNNSIRTNYIKAKIDNIQQNSKCRLCENRDEAVNHIVNENSELVLLSYKTTDWEKAIF